MGSDISWGGGGREQVCRVRGLHCGAQLPISVRVIIVFKLYITGIVEFCS